MVITCYATVASFWSSPGRPEYYEEYLRIKKDRLKFKYREILKEIFRRKSTHSLKTGKGDDGDSRRKKTTGFPLQN